MLGAIMLSASWRPPHLLHVDVVRRRTWSIDKSWRCDIVWVSPSQSHSLLLVKPHFLRHALQWPWPVLKRFSSDHGRWWRSKPVSRIVGSSTKLELTTVVADCQSSRHRFVTSIVSGSLHSGLRDFNRSRGAWKTSSYNGNSLWHSACVSSLPVAALRRRAGGSMFVRTGNHGKGVDRTVPNVRRMEECSWASIR